MPQRRRRRLLEISVVILLIGVLLWHLLEAYNELAVDVQKRSLALQADNFSRSLRVVNTLWRLRARPATEMAYGEYTLRFNPQGWPVDAWQNSRKGAPGEPCERLWQALMAPPEARPIARGHLWRVEAAPIAGPLCRYQGAVGRTKAGYFDYDQITGDVKSF